jgi:predicted histidine transporter YuiF (NhaC family)
MPFNKNQLKNDFFKAFAKGVDDEGAKANIKALAGALAAAIEKEPAKQVLDNEEKIKQMQSQVDEANAKLEEMQKFIDQLDLRTTQVEAKVK